MQWQDSQIKSFTSWINGFISRRGLKIDNLETDLHDGFILINLLEILTGKTIQDKYYKAPKSRAYVIANNAIALSFMLQQKISTANCSPQDLADGRVTPVMGLVWALIRHFSLKSLKHAPTKIEILSWCKTMVDGYRNIRYDGSTHCFQDGLIFCALIHKYDPTLLDYDSLDVNDAVGNLRTALAIAESKLGLTQIYGQHDLDEDFLDEKTIIAYLTESYELFQRRDETKVSTPRCFLISPRARSASSPALLTVTPQELSLDPELPSVSDTDSASDKDSDSKLDIVKVAEKYRKDQAPLSNERMKEEIEQLHIQILHMGEEFQGRLSEERETADLDIKAREETIASLEKKINELEKQQQLQSEFERVAQEEWDFIQEQKKIINQERAKLEMEKKKLADDQTLLQRARQDIKKQKDIVFEEKQRLNKDKRAILVGDLKLLDFQRGEIALQVEIMREELRLAKSAVAKLKVGEFDLEYLADQFVDEMEGMEYYNEDWWEQQRREMESRDARRLELVISVQRQARVVLAQQQREKLVKLAQATIVIKRVIRRWRAKRILRIILTYRPVSGQIVTVQSIVRRWLARRAYRMLLKRTVIAREVLDTEKTYVARLEVVVKVFIEPMKNLNLLTKDQVRTIFSEIEVILAYNRMLLANLTKRMEAWNYDTKIGDIFMKMTDFLKVYTQYVNNYDSAITTIVAVKHNEKVASFLNKCEKDARCMGLGIGAFLIAPIQRLPRYVLLLQDLFKYTPSNHADYEDLHTSLWKMKHVADYVNDKKKDADNIHEVLSIQDKLVGRGEQDVVLAQPHRRYLKEGILIDLKDKKKRYHFLFNDLLVATKKSQKPFTSSMTFKFLYKIPLNDATVISKNLTAKTPYFTITNGKTTHILSSFPPEENLAWFFELSGALEKLTGVIRTRSVTVGESGSSSRAHHRFSMQL